MMIQNRTTKIFFFKLFLTTYMNSQPLKPENLITYPPQLSAQLQQYRTSKTLQKLNQTSIMTQKYQFNTLNEGIIKKSAFYLEQRNMDRYSNIWTYQHSRVMIKEIGNEYYLNANEVRSLVDGNIFSVFSQAPISPFDNFWEAVYYKDVKLVVMLCMFYDPKRGQQAQQYWPNAEKTMKFSRSDLKVSNIAQKIHNQEYIETQFVIEGRQGKKLVKHIHWMGWADVRKPLQSKFSTLQTIITACLQKIQKSQMIWIHCSAGIGRTGTLGAILQAIRIYNKYHKLSIFQIVENLRQYRFHAVQSQQQYRFLYSYLIEKLSKP